MPKFQLVTGSHVRDHAAAAEEAFYKAGDIVESSVDLEKAFGKEKFIRVAEAKELEQTPEAKFEAMTVAKLKEFAAEHAIEIPEDSKKADIVKILVEKAPK